MTSFTSDQPSSGRREYRFNKGSGFAVFLEEEGLYLYTSRSPISRYLPSLVALVIIAAGSLLYAAELISIYEEISTSVIGLVAGIVLFVLLWRKSKKVPKGSNKAEWDSSGIKPTFHEWSQVGKANLDNRKVLFISMGSAMKKRTVMLGCRDMNIPELQLFLSEKIGGRFKTKISSI